MKNKQDGMGGEEGDEEEECRFAARHRYLGRSSRRRMIGDGRRDDGGEKWRGGK